MKILDPATLHDDPPCYTDSEQRDLDAAWRLQMIAEEVENGRFETAKGWARGYMRRYADQEAEFGACGVAMELLAKGDDRGALDALLEEAGRLEARADQ